MTFDELTSKLDEQLKLMNINKLYYDNNDENIILPYDKTSYYRLGTIDFVIIRYKTKVVLFTDSMKNQFYYFLKENEIDDNSFDLIIKSVQKVLSEIKKEKIKEKIKQIKEDFQ